MAATWTALVNPVKPTRAVPEDFYKVACALGNMIAHDQHVYLGVCGQNDLSAQVECGVLQELLLQKKDIAQARALAVAKPLLYLEPPATVLSPKARLFAAAKEKIDDVRQAPEIMLAIADHVVALPCAEPDMQQQAVSAYRQMCDRPSKATLYLLNTAGCYEAVYGEIFRDGRENPDHRKAADRVVIADSVAELKMLTLRCA